MKHFLRGIIFELVCCTVVSGQNILNNCYQKTVSNSDLKKLESNMCIPNGYIISRVILIDINGDGLNDKIIRWYKEGRKNGDTTFHSFFIQENTEYRPFATYNNLTTIYFDEKSQGLETSLEDSTLNAIKNKYNYYGILPEFFEGGFIVKFYIDAVEEKKMFFTFSKSRDTFVLTKEQNWFAPMKEPDTEKLMKEVTYPENEGLDIKTFNMLDYLW